MVGVSYEVGVNWRFNDKQFSKLGAKHEFASKL